MDGNQPRYQSKSTGKVYRVLFSNSSHLALVPVHGPANQVRVTHQVFGLCFLRVQ